MSHFLDRLTFFTRPGEVSRTATASHAGRPSLGRRLPQALAARQDRALDAWRELHRLVLLEDLRQGRNRHLGNAADRLSTHACRFAEPRAAWLRAWRQLFLVPLFRQPGEISARPLAPAQVVARSARADDAGRGLEVHRRKSREAESYVSKRGLGGFVRSTWDEVNETDRGGQRLHGQDATDRTACLASRRSRRCRW